MSRVNCQLYGVVHTVHAAIKSVSVPYADENGSYSRNISCLIFHYYLTLLTRNFMRFWTITA